jgi:hypothetical protein
MSQRKKVESHISFRLEKAVEENYAQCRILLMTATVEFFF